MSIGFRHIRYFTAVAEELHFRRAAERLNIAQPALSRAVQGLEAEVGVRLLDRNNRQVRLTTAGQVFLQGCRATIDGFEGAMLQARKAALGEAGSLSVGYTDFAISGELPQILQGFRQRYPDIAVEPVHGFTANQLIDLEVGRLDFGFLTGPFRRDGYDSLLVQSDRFVVVLYESHPLAERKEIALSDLAAEPFIVGVQHGWQHYHDHLYRLCRAAGFEPRAVQSAFNSEGIFGLIACKMGIAVHTDCAYNYIRKGLVVRPLKDCEAEVPTLAAWNSRRITPVQQRFIDYLAGYPSVLRLAA